MRRLCEQYDLPYNTGPFFQQWGMVQHTIVRLAFPGGKRRPKAGPHREPPPVEKVKAETNGHAPERNGAIPAFP